jgi:predicted transcriptional regulator
MKISEIISILEAEVYSGKSLINTEVRSACASDMMSDVLAFVKDQSVLITGLNNLQIIRTAEMMDMKCVVLVRGKKPDEALIKLANDKDIVLLGSNLRMYQACGLLYEKGLSAGDKYVR